MHGWFATPEALNLWPALGREGGGAWSWAGRPTRPSPGPPPRATPRLPPAGGGPPARGLRPLLSPPPSPVDEANDAAQEAFVRAYAALATYDAAQPFAPWVLRIARNHCLDLLRRRVPADRLVELDAPSRGGAAAPELVDERASAPTSPWRTPSATQVLEAAVAEPAGAVPVRWSTSSTSSSSATSRSPR